jgi:ParB-like chromosome segregation protein Spo0J
MASTIRHNRARGKHSVLGMTNIVVELVQMGWSDEEIGKHLGMDADEVLRLKQVSGIAELFRNREYSRSWVLDEGRKKA